MQKNLTKADVVFGSVYLYTEGDVVKVNVGYKVTTNEGETISRDIVGFELTGGAKTRARSLLAALKTEIRTQEGL